MADHDKEHDKPRQIPVLTSRPAGAGHSPADDVPHQVRIYGSSSAPHAGDTSGHLGVSPGQSMHEQASFPVDPDFAPGAGAQAGVSASGRAASESAVGVGAETGSGSSEFTNQIREQGFSLLEQQKEHAVDQVTSVAHAFRNSSNQLRQQGNPRIGQLMSLAADQVEAFGSQLRDRDVEALLRDTERMARSSPTAFFAGSVAVGFVLARFLKSSSERRHHATYADASGMAGGQRQRVDTSPLKHGSAFSGDELTGVRSTPADGSSHEPR